jgi:integrase
MARIRKHRNKWQVLYRDPATKKERSAGVFRTKSDAEEVKVEIEYQIAKGKWIDPDTIPPEKTFAEWWLEIEPTWLRRSESTRSRDRTYFRSLIGPYLGDTLLESIERSSLGRWVATLQYRGYSPATIAKAAQLVARTLQEAHDHDLISKNPATALKGNLPKIEDGDTRVITAAEAHRLADTIADRYKAFVLIGFYAGTRWGETAAIRRSGVDLRRDTVRIEATLARDLTLHPPKTTRSRRTIHLPLSAVEPFRTHLDRYHQIGRDPDLVFTAPEGGPIRYTNWRRRIWIPATTQAGLKGLRFHELRHSHATLLIDAGIDPVRVSSRLGHSRTSITVDRYAHLLDRDEDAILRVLNEPDTDRGRTDYSPNAAATA